MEKFVAFGLYRKNELGGHQPAQLPPKQGSEVYLAADVDALLPLLQKIVAHQPGTFWSLTDEIEIHDAAEKAIGLMVR
jgi:hypothetical protein